MKNKAQVTLYVIIGLLLIVLVAAGVYYNASVNADRLSGESKEPVPSQEFLTKVVDDCVSSLLIDSIDIYGICKTEDSIKETIMGNLSRCIGFSRFKDQDYTVTAKDKPDSVEASIKTDEISVKVNYPIQLQKGEDLIKFESTEFILPRTKTIDLGLDSASKTRNDLVLVSSDLDLELSISKGTKITSSSQPVDKLGVYIKEMCPDDPSVLGRVKYVFTPDNIDFSPTALLTIKYEDAQVSRLSKEESFKLAYLKGEHWEFVESSANIEKNRVSTTLPHLSEWVATCDGTNKYGMEMMFQDTFFDQPDAADEIISRDLDCTKYFSGSCGYAKLIVYLTPGVDNSVQYYVNAVNKIYDQELIPVLTFKEKRPVIDNGALKFWFHPGACQAPLDCKYGENEDGSAKPVYDYSNSAKLAMELIDAMHKDKPQWPLYVEIWEEPNLAKEWGDISVTDYEIKQYAKYYSEVAAAIKTLPHSEAVKIMPAGLAPTTGLRQCELTPATAKETDGQPDTFELPKIDPGAYSFTKGDCRKLGYMSNYIAGGNNYCTGETPMTFTAPSCHNVGDCKNGGCGLGVPTPGDPCCGKGTYSQDDVESCECTPRTAYFNSMKAWKSFYSSNGLGAAFQDITPEPDACSFGHYDQVVVYADKIKKRIESTLQPYCFEKKLEINTNEYLTKMLTDSDYGKQVCQNADMYADHSFPSVGEISAYPGGIEPFGMEAYQKRFELAKSLCTDGKLTSLDCTSANNQDTDGDGVINIKDNCLSVANPGQQDWDKDGIGDACDDSDHDGALDSVDKCANNPDIQTGDDSADNDGWAAECDNCVNVANPDQIDMDIDKIGDACDDNTDDDGVPDSGFSVKCVVNTQQSVTSDCNDNCPYVKNPDQKDEDGEGLGDACDNCVNYPNADQKNFNKNTLGDACEDSDGDGFYDNIDLCPETPSTENKPEVCQPANLCVGKIMITKTAWAPNPDVIQPAMDLDVDKYAFQMNNSFDTWTKDKGVLAAIPFHIGESDEVVLDSLRNYRWTKEYCSDSCVGKEIFNIVAKIPDPKTSCDPGTGPSPIGPCTTSKITIQNLGAEVGPNRIVYKCYKCIDEGTEPKQDTFFEDYIKVRKCAAAEPSVAMAAEEATTAMPGWGYRMPITITNTGSALADYQVLVSFSTATLITGAKMKSDCGDVRFTASDGTTPLSYWLDSKLSLNADTSCNKAATAFWVKLPTVAQGANTIYIYYGNDTAVSQSNPEATMEFFDSFESEINAEKWLTYKTSPDSTIISSSAQSYDGSKSIQVWQTNDNPANAQPPATPNQGSDPDTYLYHMFAENLPRTAEIAFYDNTATANFGLAPLTTFTKGSSRTGLQGEPQAYLQINNDPAGGGKTGKYLFTYPEHAWQDTGVARSNGWHILTISQCGDSKLKFYVDGTEVAGSPIDSASFDGVGIADAWGSLGGKRLGPEPTQKDYTVKANGVTYDYYGMSDCFETKGIDIPEFCPDSDGTVREGIPCGAVNISNTTYYGLVRCIPSLTSTESWFHACGTEEQCDYNKGNCCESGGSYGNQWHTCKEIAP